MAREGTVGHEGAKGAGDARQPSLMRRLAVSAFSRLAWKWRALLVLATASALCTTTIVLGALVYYTFTLPNPLTLRQSARAPSITIRATDGQILAERGTAHDFVPIDLLPGHVIDAVLATEDRRFMEHWGVDVSGLIRAAFANIRAGRFAQGGSTLTQQLAKNLFLTPDRTMARKLEEMLIAFWLELRLSKRDILELYLNRVYFGAGAYGIEAAAQRYFDKSARALNLSESAVIAGLLKAPSRYAPAANRGLARLRARSVLKKMRAAGLITSEQEAEASAQSPRFADAHTPGRDPTGFEYAVDFIQDRLPPLLGTGHQDIVIETTIDAELQRRAQSIVRDIIATEGERQGVTQAAVVVLDLDGSIRAIVGGRSWQESQFNRVIRARRQPGSAFKPVVYLAAMENGMTAETTAFDLPMNVDGWSPRNDNGQHIGPVSLRHALARSINTVAVRLLMDVGVNRVVAAARRLGITSTLRPDPSLALGTSEVNLLELTSSYAVLASGGVGLEPFALRQAHDGKGATLFKRPSMRPRLVVPPEVAGELTAMLETAVVAGTGRRAALLGHPTAGKTGTTQDHRDAWFIGYTAYLTAGVWVGNDNGQPTNKVTGGGLPARIWREVMTVAHRQLPTRPLTGTGTAPAARTVHAPATSQIVSGVMTSTAEHGAPPVAAPDTAPAGARLDRALPTRIHAKPATAPSTKLDEAFIARALTDLPPPK